MASTTITPENIISSQHQTAAIAAQHSCPPTHNNNSNRNPPLSTAFFSRTTPSAKTQFNFPKTQPKISPKIISDADADEDDPELQTYSSDVEDLQSNATSDYNSGGSDLENAARRILRDKKRYPSPRTVKGENAEFSKSTMAGEKNRMTAKQLSSATNAKDAKKDSHCQKDGGNR
mmetsp:Transcript_28993/g.52524  ORF Transcript_28993/g.52524 Transcript_28993/m.52524 type:complete len:175 (-) Transcript_28993:1177-1701(-)